MHHAPHSDHGHREDDVNAVTDRQIAAHIMAFLRAIGLVVEEAPLAAGSFLPGVRVVRGGLCVDMTTLRWPGDLLHEAGHLAVVPAALRVDMDDALEDLPSVPQGGEIEATAWAWAALCHLGLPSDVLFHDGGYRGHAAGLRRNFEWGVYLGVTGLVAADMTDSPNAVNGMPYPRMRRWLRE